MQHKKVDYAETVEKLEQVNLNNRQLEEEQRRLQAELSELDDQNQLEHIRPSAPTLSNGYSDSDSNNSSTSPTPFRTRVGRDIIVEPAHAVAYRKTEQLWFAKVTVWRHCLTCTIEWKVFRQNMRQSIDPTVHCFIEVCSISQWTAP